jgi:hypothetical protein
MSTLTETTLADMKGGFPPAPEPIHGIPTLTSLIDLLFHLCRCAQTHRSPASAKMNLLFCAAPRDVYAFLTTEAYPDAFAPFPPVVADVPDFSQCSDDNDRAAVRATHARDKKTRADIVTMNAALCDVFLENMSASVRASVLQRRLSEPNIVFVDLFLWFVKNYGKTTAEDREENRRRMAADWHPTDGFDSLIHRLFTGAGYSSSAGYPMHDADIIDIGLRVIKRCGMYSEEYKQWIAREAIRPKIVETFSSFKTFWADKIALVNQTAIPASLHGYGMAAIDDDDASVTSYGESIANFGAAYAATQESIKTQGTTIASLQSQLGAMQQYCMAVQQQQQHQPPPPVIARQPNNTNRRGYRRNSGSGSGGFYNAGASNGGGYNGGGGQHAPGGGQPNNMQQATPYKKFENWNYCHTHGGDIDNTHTSQTCTRPGPSHNWHASRQNTMAGSTAGMHKTILPSISGRPLPSPRATTQRPARPHTWQPLPPPVNFTGHMGTAMRPPTAPYQAIYNIGQQPPWTPPTAPPTGLRPPWTPPSAPPAGAMPGYYVPYPQPPAAAYPPPF